MKSRMFRIAARRSAHRAHGFTLLEMMLVVVIMGVLISVVAVNVLSQGKTAKISATRQTLATTASMIKNYNLQEGAYPSSLDVLVPKYLEKIPLDAWKRPVVYIGSSSAGSGSGAHPFTLYSTGEAGDTSEVIDYWDDQSANRPQ